MSREHATAPGTARRLRARSCAPPDADPLGTGPACIAAAYDSPTLRAWLEELPQHLEGPDARELTAGRNRNCLVPMPGGDGTSLVVVKRFGCTPLASLLRPACRSRKAWRTWTAARHLAEAGVGTPEPIACLERQTGGNETEAFFIARYVPDAVSLAEALSNLYACEPYTERFMALMQVVANAVRRMHDAGFMHNDLGNQNILLRRTGTDTWDDVCFIDLNRGRILAAMTTRQRARDLSRLALPSDFMRVFIHMYWGDTPPPPGLKEWERRYRERYRRHHRTRRWRHPLRERRRRAIGTTAGHRYPAPRDMWVWDQRSGQALVVMRSRDRLRLYPLSRHLAIVGAVARALLPVWRRYRRLLPTAFRQPVEMRARIGMTVEPDAARWPSQQALLRRLGPDPLPVLIRFYHHAGDADSDFRAGVVRTLHAAGHSVSIALVQDRAAVRHPDRWQTFLQRVLAQTAPCIDGVEVTHALNRVKWGIWDFREFRALMQPVAALARQYPAVTFMGPAVIDFEVMYTLGALEALPPNLHLGAMSHLLYVDRRGGPEQHQSGFSTLEKTALARAIAAWSPRCEDRLVISEVNWPLLGTGVYSPVGAPYVTPGPRTNDPAVDEDTYARYMVRYLLITLCSGFAERVFWWRLAAHGFGLVDDLPADGWRERPAFRALQVLLDHCSRACFTERCEWPSPTGPVACGFWFRRPDGSELCVAYVPEGEARIPVIPGAGVCDLLGHPVAQPDGSTEWTLTESPIYITCPR